MSQVQVQPVVDDSVSPSGGQGAYGANGFALNCLTEHPNDAAPQEGIHLYHFGPSQDSAKVRMMMALHKVAYKSHHLNLFTDDQHKPDYVRINPRCVVPTLVVDGKVTTDSNNICQYIERTWPVRNASLTEAQKKDIREQCEIVDGVPQAVITYGANPDGDNRPGWLKSKGLKMAAKKRQVVRKMLEQNRDDAVLTEAYTRKLKVLESFEPTMVSEEAMRAAFANLQAMLEALERKLADPEGFYQKHGFLCAEVMTQADTDWIIQLDRFKFIGFTDDERLSKLPTVAKFQKEMRATSEYYDAVAIFRKNGFMIPNVICPTVFPCCTIM